MISNPNIEFCRRLAQYDDPMEMTFMHGREAYKIEVTQVTPDEQ